MQVAKRACLGATYDCSALPVVLTGQALSEAQQRSSEFKGKGWWMDYNLAKCHIQVPHSAGGGGGAATGAAVVVTATFEESASLYGKDGRAADYYQSSHRAEYHVVRGEGGAWRITKIVVDDVKN